MEWLNKFFEERDNFPRPVWEDIYKYVDENYKESKNSEVNELWCEIVRCWMNKIVSSQLSDKYLIHESESFILVTSEDDNYVQIFLGFLERTLGRILNSLQGIASGAGLGKHLVLMFDDIDLYYSYLSYFYPENGEYSLSSGVYLNDGYGHFAFPCQELIYAESIAAHEMTHALVSHLPIPAWLNEGLAVNIENTITGSYPFAMDNEMYSRHKLFWGEEEIQKFWAGDIFHEVGEGNELAYYLAQYVVRSLSNDYGSFKAFVNKANYADGGELAAIEVYGGSLGEIIGQYFGEGRWSPAPDVWEKLRSNK